LDQFGFWHKLGHQGLEGGRREGRRRAYDCPNEAELEKASISLGNKGAKHRYSKRPGGIGPEQHGTPAETIGDSSTDEQEGYLGSGRGDADQGERRRVVRNGISLPRHCDEKNTVPKKRYGHARPQGPEVPPLQWSQHEPTSLSGRL
jgi:hypothetical protein